MKRLVSFVLILSLMLSLFVACGKNDSVSGTRIYYVNTDKTGITPVEYDFSSEDSSKCIEEALGKLGEETGDIDYITTIPSGVELSRWELNDGALALYFVGDYDSLDMYTEILVRAAIVKTLAQIDDVKTVTFYVNNSPLVDSSGESVGAMSADTFIEDFGQETDSLLSTELKLYFASADGMSVVQETREVYYSSNVTVERLVVEQLLKGPKDEGLLSAIPTGTKVNSISVTENGVCIVNFDGTIETALTGITEKVTIYSIVNSLTELDSIKQVQILVNGATPHLSNVDVDLASPISRNEDIINSVPVEEIEEDDYIDEDDFIIEEVVPEETNTEETITEETTVEE